MCACELYVSLRASRACSCMRTVNERRRVRARVWPQLRLRTDVPLLSLLYAVEYLAPGAPVFSWCSCLFLVLLSFPGALVFSWCSCLFLVLLSFPGAPVFSWCSCLFLVLLSFFLLFFLLLSSIFIVSFFFFLLLLYLSRFFLFCP